MKLRVLPIVVSVIATSVIMFGGWFVYHSLAMETPLGDNISALPGVLHADVSVDNDKVAVSLRLSPDADLRRIIADIHEAGGDWMNKRELEVKVDNPRSEPLEQWWSQVLFEVAEAMENRAYAAIPDALERHLPKLPGLAYDASMDGQFVYVRLVLGEDSKFVMLPRMPAQLRGWSDE